MATSFTPNASLQKPATADRNWDVSLNANSDFLDGVGAIGQLLVAPAENPSASLNVRVSPGAYIKADGTFGSFPGSTGYLLPPSSTLCLWLTDAGGLMNAPSFPNTASVRLAKVVTGASAIQSISDQRVNVRTAGTGLGFVLKSGDTISGPFTVNSSQSGATALAVNPDAAALGFFGAAPATAAASVPPIVDNTNGIASSTLLDVGSAFSQAAIDGNFATLAAKVNALISALKRHGLMAS